MDGINPGFTAGSPYDPNGVFASDHPRYIRDITIVSGQNLAAGALLGRVTASGKFKLSAVGAGDGSETPVGVLLQATDASGGDKTAPAAFSGGFDQTRLVYGAGHTPDSVAIALGARRIYLYNEMRIEARDTTGPGGYACTFAADYQLGVDADAVTVNVTGAEPGCTFALTLSSSGGGTPVVETGTVATAAFDVEAIDLSGLTAGTLTASLVLTDAASNAGFPATDTATLAAAA